MPDTSPQRLEFIRHYCLAAGQQPVRVDVQWAIDLLAMIDALEAQVRDLTKPEDSDLGKLDPNCPYCHGKGFGERHAANNYGQVVATEYFICRRCDPAGEHFAQNIDAHRRQARAPDPNPATPTLPSP